LQEYARKALDFIWEKRQRSSNLVGVTINIHTGDWVRKGAWRSDAELMTASGFEQGKNLDIPSFHHTYLDYLKALMGWARGVTEVQRREACDNEAWLCSERLFW